LTIVYQLVYAVERSEP